MSQARIRRLSRDTWMRRAGAACLACALLPFLALLGLLLFRGLPAMSLAMLFQSPRTGYYLGGAGGIAHAIMGTLLLGGGGLLIASALGLPAALALQQDWAPSSLARMARVILDVLAGVPSIVLGVFGFIVMMHIRLEASLLAGMMALACVMLPILVQGLDQALSAVPQGLKETALSLGATRLETFRRVVLRQALPGLMSAHLLALGRGLGDAACVLFTAGYTDRMPSSLMDPAPSLPLAIFYLVGTPDPGVQARGYAAAFVLCIIFLIIHVVARLLTRRYSLHLLD